LSHAFLWEYSYKGLKFAPRLGQLGVFLTSSPRADEGRRQVEVYFTLACAADNALAAHQLALLAAAAPGIPHHPPASPPAARVESAAWQRTPSCRSRSALSVGLGPFRLRRSREVRAAAAAEALAGALPPPPEGWDAACWAGFLAMQVHHIDATRSPLAGSGAVRGRRASWPVSLQAQGGCATGGAADPMMDGMGMDMMGGMGEEEEEEEQEGEGGEAADPRAALVEAILAATPGADRGAAAAGAQPRDTERVSPSLSG
jgi:hypothetical protein